jgi:hypothetical protein
MASLANIEGGCDGGATPVFLRQRPCGSRVQRKRIDRKITDRKINQFP